jgi:hypothetical protein
MQTKLILNSAIVLLSSAGLAFGTTITFDDLSAPVVGSGLTDPSVANGYGSLNWNNFEVVNGTASRASGYKVDAVSPNNVVFNGNAGIAEITGSPFNLVSGYFAGAWNDGLQLLVQGYVGNSATPTFSQTFTLSATSSSLLVFNWSDVDKVDFSSSGGTWDPAYQSLTTGGFGEEFAMDNLTVTPNFGVPDASSTGVMFSAALAGLGIFRRKLS